MTSNQLSEYLARRTLASIGTTPEEIRAQAERYIPLKAVDLHSWQGRVQIGGMRPSHPSACPKLREGSEALKKRLAPYRTRHGEIIAICRRAGYSRNPVSALLTGATLAVNWDIQRRMNAALDEMEATKEPTTASSSGSPRRAFARTNRHLFFESHEETTPNTRPSH